MKKAYQKPMIMFEDFSLTVNIAGDCSTIIGNHQQNSCPYITRTGLYVFTSEMVEVCTTHEDDGEFNSICYHVPIDEKNLFNS